MVEIFHSTCRPTIIIESPLLTCLVAFSIPQHCFDYFLTTINYPNVTAVCPVTNLHCTSYGGMNSLIYKDTIPLLPVHKHCISCQPPPPLQHLLRHCLPESVNIIYYPSHTALRERRDASVAAKSAVAEASRRSRISIIAVVEPSCNRPVTFPVTEASPKHPRKIKHVQFFPRLLGDCLVTERSWARRGHVV